MKFHPTPIAGLMTVESPRHADNRGYFMRVFCGPTLAAANLPFAPVQANMSYSEKRGTLRGMHYQTEAAPEAKLFRCIRGAVFDVCVDLRRSSATFMQHFSIELSAENGTGLLIPPGMAHGFLTLQDDTQVLYMTSEAYSPGNENAVRYSDPRLGITWPFAPTVISERDAAIADLPADFIGVDMP